ncbi:hypothetical protein R1sor_003744 [Riccia sorocarpa]|uniref:C2H2-type domain-containing protein n=1 Tax=Riccia sorocarpa TaxID=122646 RepID=A0ABD3H5A3_9MARC
MVRSINGILATRQPSSSTPYHLVRDRKGRRVILCSVADCVEAFQEIPAFNNHLVRFHAREAVKETDIHRTWQSMTVASRRRLRRELGFQDSAQDLPFMERHQKEAILGRLKSNLLATLMSQYNLIEDEAIVHGGLDETIVDYSDDEDS